MGTEAQKLITVSLEKIANCRRRRREMSLHKNLLVTTVIHKARIAIMEETYYMMSYANKGPSTPEYVGGDSQAPYYNRSPAAAATPVYGNPGAPHYPQPPSVLGAPSLTELSTASRELEPMEWENAEPQVTSAPDVDAVPCESGDEDDGDKENLTPVDYSPCCGELTSQRLSSCRPPTTASPNTLEPIRALKRHRMQGSIADEDDESSLPKRIKWDVTAAASEMDSQDDTSHALRLVSVFSASLGSGPCPAVRLVRSMSTPDLCSQQAKDTMELMGSRPLAIAV